MRSRPSLEVIGEYDGNGGMLPRSYGGIVFDALGRVLLCKPTGGFGGYAWTFPKLRDGVGGTQVAIACRAVRTKAGVEVTPMEGRIPYAFKGSSTASVYYFLRPVTEHGDFDRSLIAQIAWAYSEESLRLIDMSENEIGRRRDEAVLEQAILWKSEPVEGKV